MTSSDKQWFVLRVPFRNELKVRDGLRRAGFRAYVPMQWQVQTVRGCKERKLVPAVSALVFVFGEEEAIGLYKTRCKDTVYWMMTDCSGKRDKMIVSEKAMNDFIRITEQSERSVTYFRPEELQLDKGDRIRIHGGAFDGVEGILIKVKGKREKQLVVSIPDLAVAAVSVKPDVVEVVSLQRPASHNILGDAKELIRLSTTMLTSPPDKETSRHEWDLLYREIQSLYQSLLPRKGYIAATEAQLSLSLLLAERVIDSVTDTTIQRCHKAASRLRPSKLRDQLLDEIKKNTQ
jgi:ribosomal protein L24